MNYESECARLFDFERIKKKIHQRDKAGLKIIIVIEKFSKQIQREIPIRRLYEGMCKVMLSCDLFLVNIKHIFI